MKRLAVGMALLALSACTPSETACNTADSLKLVFDEFALEGEFSQNEILAVNAVYDEGKRFCEAPPGTYDQAEVFATATKVVLTLRRVLRDNDVAYQVMAPQLDKLEQLLKEAKK